MLTKVVETLEKEIKGTQKMKQKKTASRAVHTALAKRTQKDTKNIVTSVRACIAPIVSSLGYELWDVEYVKEGTQYYLRITIDAPNGIDITDCERVHRAIDAPLDVLDPIPDAYMLQVSSPGIERELKTPEHLRACEGETVCVHLFAPLAELGGRKQLTGILGTCDDETLQLLEGTQEWRIPKKKIAQVKTVYDYSDMTEDAES